MAFDPNSPRGEVTDDTGSGLTKPINDDMPDEDTVRRICDEMCDRGLAPLTDDERLEREAWREKARRLTDLRKVEHEHRQAVADEAARQQEADEIAERNRQATERNRQDFWERQKLQQRSNDLAALKTEAVNASAWRNSVRNALAHKQRQSILNEVDAMINPPPPPEPIEAEVEVGYDGYPDKETGCPRLHRWF